MGLGGRGRGCKGCATIAVRPSLVILRGRQERLGCSCMVLLEFLVLGEGVEEGKAEDDGASDAKPKECNLHAQQRRQHNAGGGGGAVRESYAARYSKMAGDGEATLEKGQTHSPPDPERHTAGQ